MKWAKPNTMNQNINNHLSSTNTSYVLGRLLQIKSNWMYWPNQQQTCLTGCQNNRKHSSYVNQYTRKKSETKTQQNWTLPIYIQLYTHPMYYCSWVTENKRCSMFCSDNYQDAANHHTCLIFERTAMTKYGNIKYQWNLLSKTRNTCFDQVPIYILTTWYAARS